eukprot:CAMPEP_0196673886 /NCGR_PEP_ID=MMETSP1090-20130531/3202_1 /TAXON_ID=37098 /ORGANISM="Isochrysis sp, Strain CCMP1244" /LENGTH=67 /DNA_ID=CAMNT_0042011667 /DNA_START=152 /DNA_END=353 /DNA_ORIENTATION=-
MQRRTSSLNPDPLPSRGTLHSAAVEQERSLRLAQHAERVVPQPPWPVCRAHAAAGSRHARAAQRRAL